MPPATVKSFPEKTCTPRAGRLIPPAPSATAPATTTTTATATAAAAAATAPSSYPAAPRYRSRSSTAGSNRPCNDFQIAVASPSRDICKRGKQKTVHMTSATTQSSTSIATISPRGHFRFREIVTARRANGFGAHLQNVLRQTSSKSAESPSGRSPNGASLDNERGDKSGISNIKTKILEVVVQPKRPLWMHRASWTEQKSAKHANPQGSTLSGEFESLPTAPPGKRKAAGSSVGGTPFTVTAAAAAPEKKSPRWRRKEELRRRRRLEEERERYQAAESPVPSPEHASTSPLGQHCGAGRVSPSYTIVLETERQERREKRERRERQRALQAQQKRLDLEQERLLQQRRAEEREREEHEERKERERQREEQQKRKEEGERRRREAWRELKLRVQATPSPGSVTATEMPRAKVPSTPSSSSSGAVRPVESLVESSEAAPDAGTGCTDCASPNTVKRRDDAAINRFRSMKDNIFPRQPATPPLPPPSLRIAKGKNRSRTISWDDEVTTVNADKQYCLDKLLENDPSPRPEVLLSPSSVEVATDSSSQIQHIRSPHSDDVNESSTSGSFNHSGSGSFLSPPDESRAKLYMDLRQQFLSQEKLNSARAMDKELSKDETSIVGDEIAQSNISEHQFMPVDSAKGNGIMSLPVSPGPAAMRKEVRSPKNLNMPSTPVSSPASTVGYWSVAAINARAAKQAEQPHLLHKEATNTSLSYSKLESVAKKLTTPTADRAEAPAAAQALAITASSPHPPHPTIKSISPLKRLMQSYALTGQMGDFSASPESNESSSLMESKDAPNGDNGTNRSISTTSYYNMGDNHLVASPPVAEISTAEVSREVAGSAPREGAGARYIEGGNPKPPQALHTLSRRHSARRHRDIQLLCMPNTDRYVCISEVVVELFIKLTEQRRAERRQVEASELRSAEQHAKAAGTMRAARLVLEVSLPGARDEAGRKLCLRCPLVRLGQNSPSARKLAESNTSQDAEKNFTSASASTPQSGIDSSSTNSNSGGKGIRAESSLSSPSSISISTSFPAPNFGEIIGINVFPSPSTSSPSASSLRSSGRIASGDVGGNVSRNFWKADCRLILGISSLAVSDPKKILKPRLDIKILELLDDEDEDHNNRGGSRHDNDGSVTPGSSVLGTRRSSTFEHGTLVPVGGFRKSIELRIHKLKGERKIGDDGHSLRRRRRPEKHFEKPIRDMRKHSWDRVSDDGKGSSPDAVALEDVGVLSASIEVALE